MRGVTLGIEAHEIIAVGITAVRCMDKKPSNAEGTDQPLSSHQQ